MSESAAKQGTSLQSKRQRKPPTGYSSKFRKRYGAYTIDPLTQGEVIVYFPDGSVRGPWIPRGDSQSDDIDASSGESIPGVNRDFFDALRQQIERQLNRWESEESSTDEGPTKSAAVERPARSQDSETTSDDVSQWSSAQLASEILQPQAESNMPTLREMILIAEDTGFTTDQSDRLAPWLLSFAERRRDSSDPQDEAAVWSAIRTGASMLTPDAADDLRPLLQPGHSIETSLVAVKMLGRIFEAQPPTDVDQHLDLAAEVRQIAESLLNPYAITVSQSAAMAHLAIHALAAMASSETHRIVEIAQGLGAAWFTRRTHRKLRELRDLWANRSATVSNGPRALLDRVIETLGAS